MARPVVLPKSFVAWLWPYLEAFSGRTRATVAALAVGAVLGGRPAHRHHRAAHPRPG
jgi:hypothetical protein